MTGKVALLILTCILIAAFGYYLITLFNGER